MLQKLLERNPWRMANAMRRDPAPIPVVVCVDVEPDTRHVARDGRPPWRGYAATVELLDEWRSRLEAATGRPVRWAWFLRMDPSIADGYGTPAWAVAHAPARAERLTLAGDALGLHVHCVRWGADESEWIVDHGDPDWVAHCLDVGFAAYRDALGRACTLLRIGDRFLDEATLEVVARLGVRIDLTMEPGLPPHPLGNLNDRRTGVFPDFRAYPRVPYRPSRTDLRVPASPEHDGTWLLPVTTGAVTDTEALPAPPLHAASIGAGMPAYERLGLWHSPEVFRRIVQQVLAENRRAPYLVAVMRASHTVTGARDTIAANLEFLRTHPLVSRFAFTTPEAALEAATAPAGDGPESSSS
ncbi:MAG: hypothetical protein QOG65_1406 [Actinomycetota bacterium]|nr:hypothetical protein [Actinomycetota bacterium]